MDDGKLSKRIQEELEEITRKQKYLLGDKHPTDRVSMSIIEEFLKCERSGLHLNKSLLSVLILISSHLINESLLKVLREIKIKPDDMVILKLYLYMQMSSNFLDGFLLGYSFIKTSDHVNILEFKNLDVLEIFKRIYIVRLKHKEANLIEMIDEKSNLISYFEDAYRQLFKSNSIILNELAGGNIDKIVEYLMLTFFDGILTAKIISDFIEEDKQK